VTLEQLRSADGEPFRQLFAIYAGSITPREQKPEAWMRAMVQAPDYRVWIARGDDAGDGSAGRVRGFSMLFVPSGAGFALLEYMAVASDLRDRGFGGELFRRTVERAVTPEGARLPVLLEIDSDREAATDQAMRTRRERFYRRLGCLKIAGLRYLMPLDGTGPAPEMDLMVHGAPQVGLPRADVERWLQTVYREVYHVSPDDPRIAEMLRPLPDLLVLE
jgi:GNAT superfamily N-acetyltransferase